MKRFTITQWCHDRIKTMLDAPGYCIDATAGTGQDTVFLSSILADGGEILAMDIQEMALEKTARRLEQEGFSPEKGAFWQTLCRRERQQKIHLLLDGHEHMEAYAQPESVDLILFNLGYLPGGDHQLATKAETTICALEQALSLLKKEGMISLVIYSGGDSGFAEKNAVLSWLKELDSRKYLVVTESFYNRPNHPPLPVWIKKL